MRKKRNVLIIICLLVMLTGCGNGVQLKSNKAYEFTVETGDTIQVSLDTSDKYNITSELPFAISCDDKVLSQGDFIIGEAYDEYVNAVQTDSNAKVLDSGTKDCNEYFFWSYNNVEFNYVILIGDSKTGIVLGNNISEESARECFNRLTISKI